MSRILFIGGTRFVGRAMAECALSRGHEVTLFHRGKSGADLFPQARHVLGDRTTDLDRLKGEWDVVVDVAGYKPSEVLASAQALAGKVGRYAFVSSISVHSGDGEGAITEDSPLQVMPEDWDGKDETVTPMTYGALKVKCEEAVTSVFGPSCVLFRPGLVVGPHDGSDRFTYWVRAAATFDVVEVPTTADQPVQFTDARDLGALMIHLVETGWNGTVNATGPTQAMTFGDMWRDIQAGVGRFPETMWDAEGTAPLPCARGFERFMAADNSLAVSLGLDTRPVEDTARDVWAWDQVRGLPELDSQPARFKRGD